MAKFFSYWTFVPWIAVSYCILAVVDGILGVIAVVQESRDLMKATMILTIIYLILAILVLLFYSCCSCCYACIRCCGETVVEEYKKRNPGENESGEQSNSMEQEEEVKHNYCCNCFLHFAIPMFVFIILYCILLGRGWKYAY